MPCESSSAASEVQSASRGSACAASGLCSCPPRAARKLCAWRSGGEGRRVFARKPPCKLRPPEVESARPTDGVAGSRSTSPDTSRASRSSTSRASGGLARALLLVPCGTQLETDEHFCSGPIASSNLASTRNVRGRPIGDKRDSCEVRADTCVRVRAGVAADGSERPVANGIGLFANSEIGRVWALVDVAPGG
jgi:hypothetical protein